ncbi:MAG: methionine--tRNA ligase subunit beta [Chitinophagales bacterium]
MNYINILEEFPGKEDVLRYVLCANMPETKDSEFTWKDFQARNNNELLAILGNFVNRVIVLTNKNFDGKVPADDSRFINDQYYIDYKNNIRKIVEEAYIPSIENYRFRDGLIALMDVVRLGNKLLTDFEPWKLVKSDKEKTAGILRVCLESLVDIGILAEPFLPFTSAKIFSSLKLNTDPGFNLFSEKLITGNGIDDPGYLFEKIEDDVITKKLNELEQIRKLRMEKENPSEKKPLASTIENQPKSIIQYDDFAKLDLRSGAIVQAEKIEGADKLLKIEVDLGFEKRTIVSGIALHFQPEELRGKKVIVVTNLAPRKMRGVESNGMILMAEDASGKLFFVNTDGSDIPGLSIS